MFYFSLRAVNIDVLQAFSSVNAEDSRHMSYLTETSLKDSAAMKQISYLTMVFLPASFAAVSNILKISRL